MDTSDAPKRPPPGGLPPLSADLVERVGSALFGRDYVSQLAEALGVKRLTVHRWRVGETRATPMITPDLVQLLEARRRELDALLAEVQPIAAEAAQRKGPTP